jgi:pimeloyl-ACP methyl ester carboxylesterase
MVLIRGCEIEYDLRGNGPDFVWGHGLTSSMESEDQLGLFDWDVVRGSTRLLRYDARGHGQSGSTEPPGDYSWKALAEDQLALADALGVGSYVAGGASMGCATALHAAVLAPDRVTALVLVIPPTAWATRAAQTDRYLTMADLVKAGQHEILIQGAAQLPPPDPFIGDPAWSERFPELLATTDPLRLARVFRGASTADLPTEDEIATLTVPTLILAWTGDPGHPAGTAARLQELMPHAQLALASTPHGLAGWTQRVVDFVS